MLVMNVSATWNAASAPPLTILDKTKADTSVAGAVLVRKLRIDARQRSS